MDPAKYVLRFGDPCEHYHRVLVPCVLGSCMYVSETTLAQWTPWCLRLLNWMEQQWFVTLAIKGKVICWFQTLVIVTKYHNLYVAYPVFIDAWFYQSLYILIYLFYKFEFMWLILETWTHKLPLIWSQYGGIISFYNLCSFIQSLWTLF